MHVSTFLKFIFFTFVGLLLLNIALCFSFYRLQNCVGVFRYNQEKVVNSLLY